MDLAQARVLISNDDGVDSFGIKLLERVARTLAKDVWVVAPEVEQSGAGHSLSLRRPLRIRKLNNRRFAVDGTPTDCVLMAVNQIMKDYPPDLVLSGINHGGNLGEDTTYSGTIAVAMEATLVGLPAVALSQYIEGDTGPGYGKKLRWHAAEAYTADIVRRVVSIKWPKQVFINVNFPAVAGEAVPEIAITREGRRKLGDEILESTDPRSETYYWIGMQRRSKRYATGTDLEAVNRGAISITPMSMDLTHSPTMRELNKVFT